MEDAQAYLIRLHHLQDTYAGSLLVCVPHDIVSQLISSMEELEEFKRSGLTPEEVRTLSYELEGVMHFVDKFFDEEETEESPTVRASNMRENVLQLLEAKDRRIQELEYQLKIPHIQK